MPPHISYRNTTHATQGNANVITATTDRTSHLWLRWTLLQPWVHKRPVLRRGLWLNDDVRFCFDVYQDLEQSEPGDTLTHTFIFHPCVPNLHFHYYLWGYVAEILSPSTSPIFQYHGDPVCPPAYVLQIDAQDDNRTLRQTWGTWPITHDRAWGTIGPWHGDPWYSLVAQAHLTVSYWIHRSYLHFDTSTLPPDAIILYALITLYVREVNKTAQVTQRHIMLTQGVQHTPVITTDYGHQLPYTTIGGQVHLDDCIPGDVVAIDLNAAGQSWLVPAGTTRLCIRQELDVIDMPPTLGANGLLYGSAQGPSWTRPKLTIRYMPT